MAGFDARDSTSLQREPEDYTRELAQPLQGLRIGLPAEFFAAGSRLTSHGRWTQRLPSSGGSAAQRSRCGFPTCGSRCRCITCWRRPRPPATWRASTACATATARRNTPTCSTCTARPAAQGFGAEVKRRILIGTYVLSHGYYDAYYLKAQKLRRLIAQDFAAAFSQCDVIMGPTTPTTAFNLGEKAGDPVQMYLSDIYTIAVNLAGLPGMSIPAGFGANNHPVGLQLIGNYFGEAKMLNAAHQYQRVTGWHLEMPAAARSEAP